MAGLGFRGLFAGNPDNLAIESIISQPLPQLEARCIGVERCIRFLAPLVDSSWPI